MVVGQIIFTVGIEKQTKISHFLHNYCTLPYITLYHRNHKTTKLKRVSIDSYKTLVVTVLSKLGKKLKLQVKSDHKTIIDSQTINQFDSNFGNLKIVFFTFTDHFQHDKNYNFQQAHKISKFITVTVGILLSL